MKPGALMMIAGGALLLLAAQFPGGVEPSPLPVVADVLDECFASDRASKVAILREMAGRTFDSDPQREVWWNTEIDTAKERDFAPFISVVSDALKSETMNDDLIRFADTLDRTKPNE